MTLSVCCLTADPGPRVAAALGPLHGVADEIVIAADARVDAADLAAYGTVADRVLRIEFDYLERHLAWLHAECSGEWVLRLDGDEVPSPALLDALPDLTASRDVLQYWIPRRWLWPDPDHWLRELPWFPDMQLRLVRNDGTLRFPGELHSSALPVWPAAYLDEPIYHLASVIDDDARRRERALRYELAAPGKRAPGGGPANEVFYLPEDHATREPEPVPVADQASIARVLRPDDTPPPPAAGEPIDLAGPTSPPDVRDDDHLGSLELIEDEWPLRFEAGQSRDVLVRVGNGGRVAWPWGGGQPPEIRIAHRWLDERGEQHGSDWPRQPFARELAPGRTETVPVLVTAPEEPGSYAIEIDIVHEHVAWFGIAHRVDAVVAAVPATPPAVTPTPSWRRRRRARPTLIPRTIHRVWLGDAALPEEAREFGEGWRRHHPDWGMRLWTDEDLDALLPEELRARARTYAELSNMVRYEVIRREGGVYIDCDVECRRPLEPLLRGVEAFAGEELPGRLCNAVLGAVADHPLFVALTEAVPHTVGRAPLPEATGPGLFTLLGAREPSLTRFASVVFYPYRWDEPHRRDERFPDAWAVHHWAGTWIAGPG